MVRRRCWRHATSLVGPQRQAGKSSAQRRLVHLLNLACVTCPAPVPRAVGRGVSVVPRCRSVYPQPGARCARVRGAPDRETRVSLSSAPIPDACFDRKSYRVTCTIYLNTDSTDADNAPHILAVLASLCSRPGAAGRGNHGMRASWAAQVRGRTRRVPSCGFSHSRWHWSRWQSSRAPRCWRAE